MFYGIGYTATRNPSPVEVELTPDGCFHIFSGAVDMGQGTATFLKQIAVEDLGAPMDRIRITLADTDLTLNTLTTCASRTVYYSGNALRLAISALKEATYAVLSKLTNQAVQSVRIEDTYVTADGLRIPLNRLHATFQEFGVPTRFKGVCDPAVTAIDSDGQGSPYAAYSSATQMAEVEVNTETGRVKILRIVSAHDVGRAINPLLVEEQIEGALMMGYGYALMEDFIPGKTLNFKSYKIPTIRDTFDIVPLLVEEKDPGGPFGAKGVAECALIPTPASIINAIADALGKRVFRLPANPERIRKFFKPKSDISG